MNTIGHNNGPAFGAGFKWRTHCWQKARAALMPTLPIEIVRGRVKRARQLGLDYPTYATVRATTGRDIIGFLFSSNALWSLQGAPRLPEDRRDKLNATQKCERIVLTNAPLTPKMFLDANPGLELACVKAPDARAKWRDSRRVVMDVLNPAKLPADGVLLVGDTMLEREWADAGRLAGYLPAARYFKELPA